MILNLFRRNEYFAVVQLQAGKTTVDPKLLKWIKNRFWWRGKDVGYFEPHTSKLTNRTTFVVGTPNQPNAIKRTCMIFLLELFAHLEDKNIPITFEKTTVEKFGYVVDLYTITKNLK